MYRIYRWLFNLVGFSRSQSNGFLILMPLMLFILFSEPLYEMVRPRDPVYQSDHRLDSLVALLATSDSASQRQKFDSVPVRVKMSPFDPNKVSADELVKFGLDQKTATRVVNYRNKGGKFKQPDDLLKIYGIDAEFMNRARSFIIIVPADKHRQYEPRSIVSFDINNVDAAGLKSIRGIGAKLSARIIKYRDALGGFVRREQLFEVYNLDSAVAAEVIRHSYLAADFKPIRRNVNKTEMNQLATHPYISHKVARSIVAYRLKHGEFHAVEDLRMVPGLDSVTISRLKPYLSVSDAEH